MNGDDADCNRGAESFRDMLESESQARAVFVELKGPGHTLLVHPHMIVIIYSKIGIARLIYFFGAAAGNGDGNGPSERIVYGISGCQKYIRIT